MHSRSLSGLLLLLVVTCVLLPLADAEGLIVSLDGLLPSKSDDPAIYPVLQEPQWYYANNWDETLWEPGFLEGRAVVYYKRFYAHSDMSVEFYVYLFSNVTSAEEYCIREIEKIETGDRYSEVTLAYAFAAVYDYGTQQIGVSWGTVSNLVFRVAVYTANIVEDPTEQLVSFTSLEHSRILEIANIVPEFPSAVVVPAFMMVALTMVVIGKKGSQRKD